MKTRFLISLVALFIHVPLFAQTPQPKASSVSVVPSNFRGKSFEECEKILGKATTIKDPKPDAQGGDRAFVRVYASPIPAIARIELVRGPMNGEDNPISPTVSLMRYYFQKGKTWEDAIAAIGLDPKSIKLRQAFKKWSSLIDKEEREVVWSFGEDANFDILIY